MTPVLAGEDLTKRYRGPVKGCGRRFLAIDVAHLATADALKGTLSGPATKLIMQRACERFGDRPYERPASISISHLYNLRTYQQRRRHWTETRGYSIPIAQRRAPARKGCAGFIRIDLVHQGEQDASRASITSTRLTALPGGSWWPSCARLSEAALLPVLQALMASFPFRILGSHADNGSEYINYTVAKLLRKRNVEFTKSRPCHSNDNALVETKNRAIVRKHLGYAHISQRYVSRMNAFHRAFLNPHVNFHRPCFFPEIYIDSKGKERMRYRFEAMRPLYEKLKALPKAISVLKAGITFKVLDAVPYGTSANQAAERLNQAQTPFFRSIEGRSKRAA